jgi:hypothetical protein
VHEPFGKTEISCGKGVPLFSFRDRTSLQPSATWMKLCSVTRSRPRTFSSSIYRNRTTTPQTAPQLRTTRSCNERDCSFVPCSFPLLGASSRRRGATDIPPRRRVHRSLATLLISERTIFLSSYLLLSRAWHHAASKPFLVPHSSSRVTAACIWALSQVRSLPLVHSAASPGRLARSAV